MEYAKISAGSYDLNKFLAGGYENDIISTIYGAGGSGKSNFCMMVAVSQARKGNKIIFVDTEGGFSNERFRQIHQGTNEEIDRDLQNILLLTPTSFNEQQKAFESLLKYVRAGGISLIIIDSMVMLYRLELGDAIKTEEIEQIREVNRKLARQLRILNEIARKQKIPVLVTNQVYSQFNDKNSEKEFSMVGGDLLKYWSKCLIELRNDYGKRTLILRKHRSLPEKDMAFEIIETGIKKKGLF